MLMHPWPGEIEELKQLTPVDTALQQTDLPSAIAQSCTHASFWIKKQQRTFWLPGTQVESKADPLPGLHTPPSPLGSCTSLCIPITSRASVSQSLLHHLHPSLESSFAHLSAEHLMQNFGLMKTAARRRDFCLTWRCDVTAPCPPRLQRAPGSPSLAEHAQPPQGTCSPVRAETAGTSVSMRSPCPAPARAVRAGIVAWYRHRAKLLPAAPHH